MKPYMKEWLSSTIPTLVLMIFLVIVIGNWQYNNGRIEMCNELNGEYVTMNDGSRRCMHNEEVEVRLNPVVPVATIPGVTFGG